MAAGQQCPNLDELHQFLLGRLSADQCNSVQVHLAACDACLGTVENLQADDTLVGAVRAPRREVTAADGQQVAALIQKLSGISRLPEASADHVGPATSAAESFKPSDVLAAPQDASEIGRLGTYRVLKVLGAGGMGIVFEAEDPQLKRRVALKVLKPELAQNRASRDRFLREAQAAAAIEHDHIVTILQVGEDRGVPFLAMQLLKGETLEDCLKRAEESGPPQTLPLPEVLRIAREIAAGLAAAHAQGLTHRDIKPANIWLEKSGRVKILDFGLARPEQDDAHLTQTGSIAGTPQYMSPEQAAGQTVDHRTDLFSLGCVLYRLLTGRLPFTGTSTLAVLRALALETPLPPQEINKNFPAALCALTMRQLARQPQDRPQSAEAVVELLAKIERAQASEARRAESDAQPAAVGRGWRLALFAALILLPVVPPTVWFGPTVYRFATDQGLLVIETDDPAVEVKVKQNGELIKLVDRKTGKEVALKAGTYQLELSRGKEGLKLETDQFTLKRGGREIARVRRETAAAPALVPSAGMPSGSPLFPFVVLSSGDRAEQKLGTLAEAVAAAKSGDTIEICGNGPFVLQPIDLGEKALILRAATGAWPVLSLAPQAVQADLPLLTTRASLTLEGLEFQRDGDGQPDAFGLKHVHSLGAPLSLANCGFVRRSQTKALVAAVIAERSPLVQARNCIFVGDWYAGLSLHTGDVQDCRLAVANCLFRTRNCGVHFAFFPDVPTASVQLTDCTLIAAASAPVAVTFPLLQIPAEAPGPPKVRIEARGNICPSGFMYVLFRPSSEEIEAYLEREHRTLLRQSFALDDRGNRFGEGVPLVAPTILSVAQKHRPQEPIATREEWNEFWQLEEPDSTFGPVRFAAQDLTGDVPAPDKLSPQDFRVLADSETNQSAGADVDLVGPGPPYESWKQTPAYQKWLKDIGQIKAEAVPAEKVFVIPAQDTRAEEKFATLAEAVASAASGDTIEVHGNGPMIREPIIVTGKALTIRAAAGSRPVLEFNAASLGAGFEKYVRLQTDAPLLLEGLEIRRVGATGEKVQRAEWALVCRKAPLRMVNCRFVVSTQPGTTALWADRSPHCEVRNCEFVLGRGCGSVGWTCPSTGQLIWDNSVTAGGGGPGIHIGQRPQDISLKVTRSTFLWGPALYFNLVLPPQAALGDGTRPAPPCRVEVTENVSHSGYVLGFFHDIPRDAPETKPLTAPEAEALLPRLIAWQGQRNLYPEHLNFLGLGAAGETLKQSVPRKTLEDWRQFWGPTETDSLQGRILFQGGEVATNVHTAAGQFTPGDVRLHADSAGKGAGEGGRDLGADADLVGPGAAYEKWRVTPAYQEWQRASDQVP